MEQSREDASFAEAFEASLNFKTPEQGEVLRGHVVSISGEDAYVSYGGPKEAVMALAEMPEVQVGDPVEGTVVQTTPEIRLSRKLIVRKALMDALRAAKDNNVPVEGKVGGRNKGGFDVSIGGLRAFCPLSQIDLGKVEDPDAYVGKTFDFAIIELSEDGRKVVVSRAALLKAEAAEKAAEARKTIVPGAILSGKVRNLVPFGAFVDLGGVEGLVHVSEISRRRVTDPKEVLQIGQDVEVKVLKIDEGGKRISLSMRELEADPWADIAARFTPGTQFTGTIARKTDFGLFVELEPGIDGLVHLSQLPIGMKMTDAELEIGATVTGWVREVDAEKRRLSLALREVAVGDPWENITSRYSLGQVVEGTVERIGPPGVFIQLEPGLTALLPMSELASKNDVHQTHHAGQKLAVKILSLDPERRRLTVSHEGAKEAAVRGEYLAYINDNKSEGSGKSALAIALEKALGK